MSGYRNYSNAFKLKVVDEVLRGKITKEEARRRYDIRGKSTVLKWIRKFEFTPLTSRPMSSEQESKKDLLKRIKQLERQLEDEKLRSEGLSKMIDIAEDQLNISIRKKSVTKQSKS
jgi:transposase-like protein